MITDKKSAYVLKANELRHYIENGGSLVRDKFILLGSRRLPFKRSVIGSFLEHLGIFRTARMCIQDPIEDVFDRLVNFQPDVIKAYPSYLLLLAREIKKRGRLIHPKFIWSNGELLDIKSRELINSAFGVDMLDGYGCTEASYIAWECTEHVGYHINVDMVVTEFTKDGEQVEAGDRGEIILTPLWNYAMPLIRYRIDDVGTASNERCPCGRGLPLMKIIEGRFEDFIELPSGKIISPLVTSGFLRNIKGITQYKIVQESKELFTIKIVPSKEYVDNTPSILEEKFLEGLGEDVHIKIKVVKPSTPSGKMRRVVSKCLPRGHLTRPYHNL